MVLNANLVQPIEEQIQLEVVELTKLWRQENLDLTPSQIQQLPALRKWLGRRRKNPLADYLVGKPVVDIPKSITKNLTADILAHFRPQSLGVDVVSLMTKIIDRGNAEGLFILCPPPIPVLLKRQSSPFRGDRWTSRDVASQLRETLALSIHSPGLLKRTKHKPQRIAEIALGQILIAAIVHAGMLAPATLTALLRHLQTVNQSLGQSLICIDDRLFIELSLRHKTQENAEFRRWFADALTAALIMYLPRQTVSVAIGQKEFKSENLGAFIWRCISGFLQSTGHEYAFPTSLSALLDAVRLDFERKIPSYLVHYAARSFVSHSLRPHAYRRLHGIDATSPTESDVNSLGPPGTGIEQDVELSGEVEPRWLSALRAVMRGDDRQSITREVDRLLKLRTAGFCPGEVGELFASFALRIFARTNTNKVRMAVSTCRAYVVSVSLRLGGLVGHDVSQLATNDWVSYYEEVLSDAPTPSIRRKLVRALREFQNFLEMDRGCDPMDAREVFPSSSGLLPVDANVISEAEFFKIREQFTDKGVGRYPLLSKQQDASRLIEIAWLILTLSFRCGLRRMEVLKLDLADVQFDGCAELLVRPTESRGLKSISSTRKLPLFALLDTVELDRLRCWVSQRQVEELSSSYSTFLFSLPKRGFKFVPQDTLFPLLHEVMREITGDPTLRFHHLRHSFASRMTVLMAMSAGMNRARVLASLPGYASSEDTFELFRQNLLGSLRPTRRDIWAVSAMLGHSGPDVSVEHYIHHLDILLAESLTCSSIAPDTRTVIAASMKSVVTAYRHQEGNNYDTWIARIYQKEFCARLEPTDIPKSRQMPEPIPAQQENRAAIGRLENIWHALWQLSSGQKSIEEISQTKGIPVDDLKAYLSTANWLHNLKLSEKNQSYRHRFTLWTPDRREPEKTVRIACPVKPHEARDIAVFNRLAASFIETYRHHKALYARVLKQYMQQATADFGGLTFASTEDAPSAKDLLLFLKNLGLQTDEIQFISYDITSTRSKQAAAWRKVLGLHSSIQIEKKPPKNGRKIWASSKFGILPIFDDNEDKKIGSAGFRFLMIMAAIAMKLTA